MVLEVKVFEHFRPTGALGLKAQPLGMNDGFEIEQGYKGFVSIIIRNCVRQVGFSLLQVILPTTI